MAGGEDLGGGGLWSGWPLTEHLSGQLLAEALSEQGIDECLFLGSDEETLDISRRTSPEAITEEDIALFREAIGPLYDDIVDEFLAGRSE